MVSTAVEFAVQFKVGYGHLRTLHEERYGRVAAQRAHRVGVLARQMQRFAARRKDGEPWALREQRRDPFGRGQEMLEVVEDEQQCSGAQIGGDGFNRGRVGRFADAQRPCHHRRNMRWIRNRRELRKRRPVLEVAGALERNFDCEARLPDAGRSHQRYQPRVLAQQSAGARDVIIAANQRGCLKQ